MTADKFFLSEHFSWAEACITQQRGLDNTIPESLEANIVLVSKQMERVRALLNVPVTVSSWYRSPEVNKAVGGAKKSDHMSGLAVDFIAPKFGSCAQIVKMISSYPELIHFNQLILEHSWVHISFSNPVAEGKREVLSLLQSGGYSLGITDKFGAKINGLTV